MPIMRRRMHLRAALIVLITVGVTPFVATAQSQDTPSVADAARHAREQKKNVSKTTKVITDEDLDKSKVQPGAQGLTVDASPKLETEPPSPAAVAAAQIADQTAAPSAVDEAATKAADEKKLAELKLQIAGAEKELDLTKRDMALEQDNYFSNPDYAHNTAGKAKLDDMQQQIKDKQADIERLKTRLSALQEEQALRKAAPVRSAARPAPPPQQ